MGEASSRARNSHHLPGVVNALSQGAITAQCTKVSHAHPIRAGDESMFSASSRASTTGKGIDAGLKPTYTDEWLIGYGTPLLNTWGLDIFYINRETFDFIEDIPTSLPATGPFHAAQLTGAERKYRSFTVELSRRLAPVANAPIGILRRLAKDEDIAVAAPVLSGSPRIEEKDLVDIALRHRSHAAEGIGESGLAVDDELAALEREDVILGNVIAKRVKELRADHIGGGRHLRIRRRIELHDLRSVRLHRRRAASPQRRSHRRAASRPRRDRRPWRAARAAQDHGRDVLHRQ